MTVEIQEVIEITEPRAMFTIEQKVLLDALKSVGCAISKRSTLPILANVLFKAQYPLLTIATCNLEIWAQIDLPHQFKCDGDFTVNYSDLLEIIKPLKKDVKITFALQDNNDLMISGGGLSVTLSTMDAKDMPYIDPLLGEQDQTITLPSATLKQMIVATAPAAATDESRPTLTGLLFSVRDDTLSVVGADSFHLHMIQQTLESPRWDDDVLIPAISLAALEKKLPKSGYVTLSLDRSRAQVKIVCGLTTFHVRTIEGNYPQWRHFLPENREYYTHVVIDAPSLKSAVEIMKPIAKDDSNITHFIASYYEQTLTTQAQRDGMTQPMSIQLKASVGGPDLDIIFNYEYMLIALKIAGSSMITLSCTSFSRPAQMTVRTIPGLAIVLMPMDPIK